MIQELNQIVTVQTYVLAQLKKRFSSNLFEQMTNCLQENWWQRSVYAFLCAWADREL